MRRSGPWLPGAMNAPDPLFDPLRIPGQVKVEQDARELEVDTLPSCRRADEYSGAVALPELPLGRELRAVVASSKDHDTLPRVGLLDLAREQVHRPEVRREDDDFLGRVLLPQRSKPAEQLVDLRLAVLREHAEQLADPEALLR